VIPKLYAPDGATLKSWLADTTVCEVAEERNGAYELYMGKNIFWRTLMPGSLSVQRSNHASIVAPVGL